MRLVVTAHARALNDHANPPKTLQLHRSYCNCAQMSRARKSGFYISPETSFDSGSNMPPRAALRQRTATPARSTITVRDTPRRSNRAVSRQPIATKDVVSNPALPEIQTQQSYAYGSSKTPALPEQLHARDISMRAVASRLDDAADEAERNFEAHAAELRGNTPDSQVSARDARAQRRVSKEPQRQSQQPPSLDTPDVVRKQARTAHWLTTSQLDEIPEEDPLQASARRETETPHREREESLASSFPTGSFNHSYNYERGHRAPNLPQPEPAPQPEPEQRPPARQQSQRTERQASLVRRQSTPIMKKISSRLQHMSIVTAECIKRVSFSVWQWMSRMTQTMQNSISELPDSPAVALLFKAIIVTLCTGLCTWAFCAAFSYMCDASSTSAITQSLQSLCGRCRSTTPGLPDLNFTGTNPKDLQTLLDALKRTHAQITQIENQLNSRIDLSSDVHEKDTEALRSQQVFLESQVRHLSQTAHCDEPNRPYNEIGRAHV